MADAADRAQEQLERTPLWRHEPEAPKRCAQCGGWNDRQADGYAVCSDCMEDEYGD